MRNRTQKSPDYNCGYLLIRVCHKVQKLGNLQLQIIIREIDTMVQIGIFEVENKAFAEVQKFVFW